MKSFNVTFGIITDGRNTDRVFEVISSIRGMQIPEHKYEIIIVGGRAIHERDVIWFPFDESVRKNWITRKKNLISLSASYDNVVMSHDYIAFDKDWYLNFCEFGEDWDICMNPILNLDHSRFRDWILCNDFIKGVSPEFDKISDSRQFLLPYSQKGLERFQYVSGSYFVCKRKVLKEFLFDESLSWGESEDIEWSNRVLREKNFKYVFNESSVAKCLKQKDMCRFFNISSSNLQEIQKYAQ